MAAFSRLQLAKALIEYDNEDLPFDQPRKNAEESAIFASLRRPRRPLQQRNTDYLGVSLPTQSTLNVDGLMGSSSSRSIRDSLLDPANRKSQASLDALQNPFGRDSTHEGAPLDSSEDIEVDLTSWGLDAFEDTDKGKGKKVERQESASSYLPNPHPAIQLHQSPRRTRPSTTYRTMSVGSIPMSASTSDPDFGVGGAFLDAKSSVPPPDPALSPRRHSVGSPLDYANIHPSDPALTSHHHKSSAHILIDNIPVTPPLHAVPFPVGDPDVEGLAYDAPNEHESNPFSVRPPSPERASRFDPKVASRNRVTSTASFGTQVFEVEPHPADSHSMMSPRSGQAGRDRPYTRLELMRPKVLIMPSPLQNSTSNEEIEPSHSREGFEFSTDGPPLPLGARSARASTANLLSPSISAETTSLIPNPRANLTLSQLTFRNTLMVDGQRDVAYKDIDEHLRWATEEGEQVHIPETVPPAIVLPVMEITDVDAADADELDRLKREKRPAGKLYGKSLIDDLEAKKAQMKGRQRVFTGDQRPSMMARTPMKRSSTLIDPESLKQRPTSTLIRLDSAQTAPEQGLSRRNSAHAKTLINFDDEIPGAPRGSTFLGADNRLGPMSNTKSVFGVDTLWEREMQKLKAIEAQEKEEEEARQRLEAQEDAEGGKKRGKGRRKGKERNSEFIASSSQVALSPSPSQGIDSTPSSSHLSPEPAQKKIPVRREPPPVVEGDVSEDEDSDSSSVAAGRVAQAKSNGWHSDEDADQGPRRTTGSGPRYANLPPRLRALQQQGGLPLDDDDSEEDLPLVATVGRAVQRATRTDLAAVGRLRKVGGDDSSDEEKPLSQLLDKTKLKLPSPTFGSGLFESKSNSLSAMSKGDGDDEDDDKPLGLRVSRVIPSSSSHALSAGGADEDEDDRPLALHPEQMRRSQFMMAAAQQQQQQQQMMMQAAAAQMQMQQSMMFGAPSIMSAPFFAPPMAPPMMIPPQLSTTPPPIQDAAKLNRVDKWRHDVAVEGDD